VEDAYVILTQIFLPKCNGSVLIRNTIGSKATRLKSSDICKFLQLSFSDEITEEEKGASLCNMQFLGIKLNNGTYQRGWLEVTAHYWYKCNQCKKIYKKSA